MRCCFCRQKSQISVFYRLPQKLPEIKGQSTSSHFGLGRSRKSSKCRVSEVSTIYDIEKINHHFPLEWIGDLSTNGAHISDLSISSLTRKFKFPAIFAIFRFHCSMKNKHKGKCAFHIFYFHKILLNLFLFN